MPALNFKAEFAPLVESGKKRCTIRAFRRHPIKVGDNLFLYTGMRTKRCRKLRDVRCASVTSIIIEGISVRLGGKALSLDEIEQLAIEDGFSGYSPFLRFFVDPVNGQRKFTGQLIRW